MVAPYGYYQRSDGSFYRGWPPGRVPGDPSVRPLFRLIGLTTALEILALSALLGCAPVRPQLAVVPYCSMPWADCPGCDDGGCEGAQEQWWCCNPGGECWPVQYATDCGAVSGGWIAYCEYGRTTEQSTPDGEGWECLG